MMKLGKYDVGYGKPPASARFQKGRSGNPIGRPRKSASSQLDESIERKLDKMIWIMRDGKREAVTKREFGIISLINNALKGDAKALRKVFDMIREMEPRREKEAFKIVYAPPERQ